MTPPVIEQIPDLETLLERAGAKPARYGKRWDCPSCGKSGRISVDFRRGLFHCWHVGCDFHGNALKLARHLGLVRKLSSREARRLQSERRHAHLAAEIAYQRIKARRLELYEAHQSLGRIRDGAAEALRRRPSDETAWSALAFVYAELPKVRAELLLLESAGIGERLAFLEASQGERRRALDRIICQGCILDSGGRVLELGEAR